MARGKTKTVSNSVSKLIDSAKLLIEAAEADIGMFENYVVSAVDRTGHQVFEETGGVDASFTATHDSIATLREIIKNITEWRPIKDAPTDGTFILIKHDTNGELEVDKAAWLDDNTNSRGRKLMCWCVANSWQDEQGGHQVIFKALGWQPLPEV